MRSVVEAAVVVRLMILAHLRLLIYLRRLKEWHSRCFPEQPRAYGRAEELSGTQEGGRIYHVISGRTKKESFGI